MQRHTPDTGGRRRRPHAAFESGRAARRPAARLTDQQSRSSSSAFLLKAVANLQRRSARPSNDEAKVQPRGGAPRHGVQTVQGLAKRLHRRPGRGCEAAGGPGRLLRHPTSPAALAALLIARSLRYSSHDRPADGFQTCHAGAGESQAPRALCGRRLVRSRPSFTRAPRSRRPSFDLPEGAALPSVRTHRYSS